MTFQQRNDWSYSRPKNEYITVKSHRYSSDIDLKLVSFSAQCNFFFLKQRHEANEMKICRTAFNFVSWDSHQTISTFRLGQLRLDANSPC